MASLFVRPARLASTVLVLNSYSQSVSRPNEQSYHGFRWPILYCILILRTPLMLHFLLLPPTPPPPPPPPVPSSVSSPVLLLSFPLHMLLPQRDYPPRHDEVVHGMCERSNDSYRSLTFGIGASGLNQCPVVLGYYPWPIKGIACARTKWELGQQIFLHQSAYRMEKLSNDAVHFKMAIISFSSTLRTFFSISYGGGGQRG
ncbi:hypothetical protein HOY80DRAFT_18896 [Tuber brumale]|nr:hypothetical protein HOY80DRAFT_18896 [Tuber brumale]